MDAPGSHSQQNVGKPELVAGSDLLLSYHGVRPPSGWRSHKHGRMMDRLFDARLAASPAFARLGRAARTMAPRVVQIASVQVPGRNADLKAVLNGLASDRHQVRTALAPMGDRGKFTNINLALEGVDLGTVDWLIVTDDDIAFPPHFLDRFICACELAQLKVAMPAHRFDSHTTWMVTQRVWNSLVHLTHYVESGPVTAFHRDVFADVLPFPETRWAWGVDVLWGEIARRRGLRMGVVDATPVEHLRPVANAYNHDAALAEARQLLERYGVGRAHKDVFVTTGVLARL